MDQVYSKISFNYSMKNIPISNREEYTLQLIHSVEKFVRNLRWRVKCSLKPEGEKKETYGFPSIRHPTALKELKLLEQRLMAMVRDIEFRNFTNELQEKLKEDVRLIREAEELIIEADKTSNHYKLNVNEYERLLKKDIHKDYKKAQNQDLRRTKEHQKEIVEGYDLSDRVMDTQARPARATLKDHKGNFLEDPRIRLLNPTKPELQIISRQILSNIIKTVRSKTKYQQWINSDDVITWFSELPDKNRLKFISFDVVSMYPSISKTLLENALQWASQYIQISDQDKETIMACKSSLLYDNEMNVWKKKGTDFDITMGAYDGGETCDICVLYLLSKVQHLPINIGAYKDDWLAVSSHTNRQTENIKKDITKIFSEHGLSLEIEANKKIINFLDITLNLNTGLFEPFMKENNKIFYVHKLSNHPPSIIKNLPQNINNRLSKISANEEVFTTKIAPYQSALDASGYTHKLTFDPNARNKPTSKRNRNRKVTWFNPPWSHNVKTNIGKKFLAIIKETFPTNHPLHKYCNRNTIKLSYRCMNNMKREVSRHNTKILNGDKGAAAQQQFKCTCTPHRKPDTCRVLPGIGCQVDNLVYRATVTRNDTSHRETYTGSTYNPIKTRVNQHNGDINTQNEERSGTTLSVYVRKLIRQNIPYTINWAIIKRAAPYNPITKICRLCIYEKFHILFHPEDSTLNQRSEFFSKCWHKETHLLSKN